MYLCIRTDRGCRRGIRAMRCITPIAWFTSLDTMKDCHRSVGDRNLRR